MLFFELLDCKGDCGGFEAGGGVGDGFENGRAVGLSGDRDCIWWIA